MAAHTGKSGKKLTPVDLGVMVRLTRDLAAALAQGNLNRALDLLEERRRALAGCSWPEAADPGFQEQVRVLRSLEKEVLDFCRTWRAVVEKRLKSLNTGHFLRMSYCPPQGEARFIDISK
jgi:hypothetical protein